MTTESPEISAEDWPAVKSLWFAVQEADELAQHALLNDSTVTPRVRMHVTRMMTAAARLGERFEQPAMVSLGMASVVEAPQPTLVGQRLGAYEVVRRVGQGGMGAVYEAVRADDVYRNRVAIKSIWRGADSDVLLQRFRSERQILAGLQHPNIAGLIDGGATAQGTPWLAMEYVDGIAIDQYCDKHQLTLPARLDLFRQVCAAVQYAHSRLVIHRDLKPSNVLVTNDGTVKLLDFGVSKLLDDPDEGTLTGAGLSPFTAAYAAPEQITGGAISTTTDVYALGALLVMLLAGEPPIDVSELGPAARLDAVRINAPRAPSAIARAKNPKLANALRGELDAIALMALRREPERRYGSAQALSEDVRRYLKRERVLARPDTLSYRIRSTVRRQPALVAGAVGALVVVLGGSLFALNQARAMRAEAARSERVGAFMAGMVAGPNSTTNDPVIRIGPQGTVADLLDSALVRVPTEFANDVRTRARLYTAIGVNYSGQARYKAARFVLDSAATLAKIGYGAQSPQYARALLELAGIELDVGGPARVDSLMQVIARNVAGTSADTGSIRSNRLNLIAEREIVAGNIRSADSVARLILDEETARGQRTMARVRAEAVLAKASSWLRRDPREFVRRCR
ncbi:MAG: serine/threonine-protein kinase [Gemmatimonadaceae bacterium]